MRNCFCGKPVRMGASKVRANRTSGVYNYIAHADGSPDCDYLWSDKWDCVALKPYPRQESEKEHVKLRLRWESEPSPSDDPAV